MERQKPLFPQISIREQWLENACQPLYAPLWRMIHEPFDDLRKSRAEDRRFRIMTEGECAQWLRPQMVQRAKELFLDTPEITVEKCNHQLFIRVREDLAIIPKKLRPKWRDTGLTFSSYDTDQNVRYWRQEPVNGVPMLPRVIVGYQFIAELTDIKIWVAYPFGKWIRNCFLMPDQSGNVFGRVVVPPMQDDQDQDDPGFKVKPKKDQRELGSK